MNKETTDYSIEQIPTKDVVDNIQLSNEYNNSNTEKIMAYMKEKIALEYNMPSSKIHDFRIDRSSYKNGDIYLHFVFIIMNVVKYYTEKFTFNELKKDFPKFYLHVYNHTKHNINKMANELENSSHFIEKVSVFEDAAKESKDMKYDEFVEYFLYNSEFDNEIKINFDFALHVNGYIYYKNRSSDSYVKIRK